MLSADKTIIVLPRVAHYLSGFVRPLPPPPSPQPNPQPRQPGTRLGLRLNLPRQRQHLLQRRIAVGGLLGQPLEQFPEAHPVHLRTGR